jgi:predicted HAD superfamily phosphohydrolase YqeG
MTTITINERTKAGKIVLELAKMLSANNKGVSIDSVLNNTALKTDAKELTPKQRTWINRLKKVKHDVAAGTFKGQNAQSFLDEL